MPPTSASGGLDRSLFARLQWAGRADRDRLARRPFCGTRRHSTAVSTPRKSAVPVQLRQDTAWRREPSCISIYIRLIRGVRSAPPIGLMGRLSVCTRFQIKTSRGPRSGRVSSERSPQSSAQRFLSEACSFPISLNSRRPPRAARLHGNGSVRPSRSRPAVASPARLVSARTFVTMTTDPPTHPVLSSIGDFVLAGLRPRTPLARAIVFVLVLKLVLVASMQVFLLCSSAQPDVSALTIQRVLGPVNH